MTEPNHYSVFVTNKLTGEISVIGVYSHTYTDACNTVKKYYALGVDKIVTDIRKD